MQRPPLVNGVPRLGLICCTVPLIMPRLLARDLRLARGPIHVLSAGAPCGARRQGNTSRTNRKTQ
eukprot:2942771-Prorocentrum_lima.AAC.1